MSLCFYGVWFCSCLIPWLKIMVLCLLAVSWNRRCRFPGQKRTFWSGGFVGGWSSLLVSPFLLRLLLLSLFFSLSLLRGLRPGTGACILLSLSLLYLDLTMPPYSPHPPPPMTPLLGTIRIFLARIQMLALARSSFLLVFSSLLFLSVLPFRDTDQVNRAHHTTLHPRERLVVSPLWRSRPLVFLFLLCVHKPHRYISVRAVSDLAGSL